MSGATSACQIFFLFIHHFLSNYIAGLQNLRPLEDLNFFLIKLEAPVVDHLSDFGANGEEYEVMKIFPM